MLSTHLRSEPGLPVVEKKEVEEKEKTIQSRVQTPKQDCRQHQQKHPQRLTRYADKFCSCFAISGGLLLGKPIREKRKLVSRNIRAIDMHDFRIDVHNLLGSTTQSNSTDPRSVYNKCSRQLLDSHAPLVTCTVMDRTSAPWMTLEIKQAKVQRQLAE